jgi:hypothetical protein
MCRGFTEYCKRLFKYVNKNLDWIRGQVLSQPREDPYWRQVNLTFTQLTGILDGLSFGGKIVLDPTIFSDFII